MLSPKIRKNGTQKMPDRGCLDTRTAGLAAA
jgi:hypothetical protein